MKKISKILQFLIHGSFPLVSYLLTGEYSKEALFPILISTIIFPILVPILYKIPLIGFIVKGIMGLYTSVLISFVIYLCLELLNIQVNTLLITMISLVVGIFLTSTMRRLTTKKEMYKRKRKRESTADDKMHNRKRESTADDKMHNRNTNKRTAQEKPKNNIGFFTGCNTREDIDKRYKGLVKVFHPDNVGGDHEMFIRVQNEYKERVKCY